MKSVVTILLLLATLPAKAADTLRVLFIGNSYVQVNNLPAIIADLAANRGRHITYTDVSVGGQTLQGHSGNSSTLAAIRQPGWDYVVLQEQSQRPAFPDAQVASDTYPYARRLDSLVHLYNPCAKTVFYMTWGRKNGDAANCGGFPLICSYTGMDSLLRSRYTIMAQQHKSVIAPVSVAWRRLRSQYPGIELFQPDESHPSPAGSYAAACSFYAVLFKADPATITNDAGLSATEAATIRKVVKEQVYDSLQKWYAYDPPVSLPTAAFSHTLSGRTASFSNASLRATHYDWQFGDGKSDGAKAPAHTYAANGTYTVRLVASNCGQRDTETHVITVGPTGIGGHQPRTGLRIFPNPATSIIHANLPPNAQQVMILSLQGHSLLKQALTAPEILSLDISALPAGSYFVEVLFGNAKRLREAFTIIR